jgi:inorganic triphosphatase YgiF
VEVEIKLHVHPTVAGGPAAFFARMQAQPSLAGLPLGPSRRIALRDLYFDTPDGGLASIGAGLRLRVENGAALVTLKMGGRQQGAMTVRQEYEEPLTAGHLEGLLTHIRPFIGPEPVPIDCFAAGMPAGPLIPVLDVVTDRVARTVGEVAVLTLDRVSYPALTDQVFWDVEVEVRSEEAGEPFLRRVEGELLALASGHLLPASMSKLERGIRLRSEII